jgi:hypothetical protein
VVFYFFFKILNSILTKTLEMDSSFLEIFISNFKFDRPVFTKISRFSNGFSMHGASLPAHFASR